MTISHAPEWGEQFGRALLDCEAAEYVVVDKATRAPVAGVAPIRGRLGIVADVERAHAGLTARRQEDATREARLEWAVFLEGMASSAARSHELHVAKLRETHGDIAREKLRDRAERAAAEVHDYVSRARAVREALDGGMSW